MENFKKIKEIIALCKEERVELAFRDGQVAVKAKQGVSDSLRQKLKEHKVALVEYLTRLNNVDAGIIAYDDTLDYQATSVQVAMLLSGLCDTSAYHLPLGYKIEPGLDVAQVEKVVTRLISECPVLCSAVKFAEDKYQFVLIKQDAVSFEARYTTPDEFEKELNFVTYEPFDLEQGPLVRILLSVEDSLVHHIVFVFHHLVFDGGSMEPFSARLTELFTERLGTQPESLVNYSRSKKQYAQYAHWQKDFQATHYYDEQLQYWREQLKSLPQNNYVAGDFTLHSNSMNEKAQVLRKTIPESIWQQFTQFTQTHAISTFLGLQTLLAVLLSRYSGNNDIVMGTALSGRDSAELSNAIGMFVKTVVLRNQVELSKTFLEQVAHHKQILSDAFTHAEVGLSDVIVQLEEIQTQSDVFEVMFTTSYPTSRELVLAGSKARPFAIPLYSAKFPIAFDVQCGEHEAAIEVTYQSARYGTQTLESFIDAFIYLMTSVLQTPSEPLELHAITSQQQITSVVKNEDKQCAYSSIWDAFVAQVDAHPRHIAWQSNSEVLSYHDLYAEALKIIAGFQALHITRGDRIVLALRRSHQLIAAQLACAALGAIYVPLDAAAPEARKSAIITDAAAKLVLVSEPNSLDCECRQYQIHELQRLALTEEFSLPDGLDGHCALYICYTSGSTGKPKGVIIPHSAVLNLVLGSDCLPLCPQTVMAHGSNLAFDAVTFEVWGALLNGGRLVPVDNSTLTDPEALQQNIIEQGINTLFLTTALFNHIAAALPTSLQLLECVLFGGEKHSIKAIETIQKSAPKTRLLHVYGPTENTTFSTCCELSTEMIAQGRAPIGNAIKGTQAWILDSHFQQVPDGMRGELVVTGDNLALGYWQNEAMTSDRFVILTNGQRGYRTGDIVRRGFDGQIEYVERLDNQVKIRGFRIEPAEITGVLLSHEQVTNAYVTTKMGATGLQLIAYVSGEWSLHAPEVTAMISSLKQHLSLHLPTYMQPNTLQYLECMPLNANGKVDFRQLPEPITMHDATLHVAEEPLSGEIATSIAHFWQELLGIKAVYLDSHFYLLGGHSLLAVQLLNRIKQHFQIQIPTQFVRLFPELQQQIQEVEHRLNALNTNKLEATDDHVEITL